MWNRLVALVRWFAVFAGFLMFVLTAPWAWGFRLLAEVLLTASEKARDLMDWGRS